MRPVKELVDNGADVNSVASDGRTVLAIALERRSFSLVERLLKEGATILGSLEFLFKETSWNSQNNVYLDVPTWDMFDWLQTEVSDINDLLKMVVLTGFSNNVQMQSCEDYILQRWGRRGIENLSNLVAELENGRSLVTFPKFTTGTTIIRVENEQTWNIKGSDENVIDMIEQICWLLCVFRSSEESHGLSVTCPRLRLSNNLNSSGFRSSATHSIEVSRETYSFDECAGKLCWLKLLRGATVAVGFPVRHRKAGIGLEIPFALLLRFAEISISMEFDGGVLLVGPSAVIFPVRKVEDGVQWHFVEASSASEAIKEIGLTAEWTRECGINELSQKRAYLGYCSRASVLLGTRNLVLSRTVKLSSCLPEPQLRIQAAREGTTSIGLSISGIFHATIQGKWKLDRGVQVSLAENRDIEDRLMRARRRATLIYDHSKDRGWHVSELTFIVHLALSYLNQEEVRERWFTHSENESEEKIPFLNGSSNDTQEAYDFIKRYWSVELYEKLEDGQMKTFGMVIKDIMRELESLQTADNLRKAAMNRSFRFSLRSNRSLFGWHFSDLVSRTNTANQREIRLEKNSPAWTMLGDLENTLVILGSDFGNLIQPNTKVPSGWETIPQQAGLLAATSSSIAKLLQSKILTPFIEKETTQCEGLVWYRPTAHPDCNQFCNGSCMVIQEIMRQNDKPCTEKKTPRKLQQDGAVVFGCASLYHKSLERQAVRPSRMEQFKKSFLGETGSNC
jgi:hypothetical protein